ncbi:MAG: hypothetical protein A4E73_01631 [Syntrophaceae bacterium PtaU1.Bin231]|nr:MAG: hypothetical protein A4E73_01631 [Syntrophaceae bacterium PtaU1.Bin231]
MLADIAKAVMVLCLSASTATTVQAADARDPLDKVLPSAVFAVDWTMQDKTTLYDSDTLFERINGEAELFFPYGFERLAVAEYANPKHPDVLLAAEVYRMGSPLDAFGIYANYRRPTSVAAAIGAEGFISATQLMYCQDRFFVRIQVTGATALDSEILLACGRAIAENLPSGGERPVEIDLLQIPSVVKRTERYVARSLLGYAFFRRGLIADAMRGGERLQVFLVPEDSPDRARQALDDYRAYLKAEGRKFTAGPPGRNALSTVDPLYGGVFVEQSGSRLIGAIRAEDPGTARMLVDDLRRRLGEV